MTVTDLIAQSLRETRPICSRCMQPGKLKRYDDGRYHRRCKIDQLIDDGDIEDKKEFRDADYLPEDDEDERPETAAPAHEQPGLFDQPAGEQPNGGDGHNPGHTHAT